MRRRGCVLKDEPVLAPLQCQEGESLLCVQFRRDEEVKEHIEALPSELKEDCPCALHLGRNFGVNGRHSTLSVRLPDEHPIPPIR